MKSLMSVRTAVVVLSIIGYQRVGACFKRQSPLSTGNHGNHNESFPITDMPQNDFPAESEDYYQCSFASSELKAVVEPEYPEEWNECESYAKRKHIDSECHELMSTVTVTCVNTKFQLIFHHIHMNYFRKYYEHMQKPLRVFRNFMLEADKLLFDIKPYMSVNITAKIEKFKERIDYNLKWTSHD